MSKQKPTIRDDLTPAQRAAKSQSPSLTSFASIGLQFAAALILFVFLGQWVDKKLGSSPLFLLAGVFGGGGLAFYSMYRRITAFQKRDDQNRGNR
jgi:F0F1-type ATP synthase assembly protein I